MDIGNYKSCKSFIINEKNLLSITKKKFKKTKRLDIIYLDKSFIEIIETTKLLIG